MGGLVFAVGAGLDGVVTDEVFKAAWRAGDIERTMWIETDVTEMASAAEVAGHDFSFAQDSAADPGSEGEKDGVLDSPGGSEPRFTKKGAVGIVHDGNEPGSIEMMFELETFEPWKSGWHDPDASLVAVGETGRADSDPGQPKGLRSLVENGFHRLQPLVGMRGGESPNVFLEKLTFAGGDHAFNAGASEIQAQNCFLVWAHKSFAVQRPSVTDHPPSTVKT